MNSRLSSRFAILLVLLTGFMGGCAGTQSSSSDGLCSGGNARATFSDVSGAQLETSTITTERVILEEGRPYTFTISECPTRGGVDRIITIALPSKPMPGQTYNVTSPGVSGGATVEYSEIDEATGTSTYKYWQASGSLTVSDVGSADVTLSAERLLMNSRQAATNAGKGNFRMTLAVTARR